MFAPHIQEHKRSEKQPKLQKNLPIWNQSITFIGLPGKETYFSVTGKDDKGEAIAVIIPKAGEKITVLNQKDGVDEQQVRQIIETDYKEKSIQKVSLGMYNDKPTWEVVTKNDDGLLSYYLLSFEKAEEIMVIKNV